MFEYIKEYYGVPAELGRVIEYNGERGLITADRGNYVGVTFDKDKPGDISNIHPTDENLKYISAFKKIRPMTRSQKNYQEYLRMDCNETFAEWMGFAH